MSNSYDLNIKSLFLIALNRA